MKRHFNFLKKVETTTHPVLLFCFYPLVHHKIEPSLVVIFILIICFLLVKNKTLIKKIKHHWLIIIIPLAIGIISSPDLVEGSRLSLRKISLLLIPVFAGFLSYRKPEELRILFFKLFFYLILFTFLYTQHFFLFSMTQSIYTMIQTFLEAQLSITQLLENTLFTSLFSHQYLF